MLNRTPDHSPPITTSLGDPNGVSASTCLTPGKRRPIGIKNTTLNLVVGGWGNVGLSSGCTFWTSPKDRR